jgi:hypothetical protein
MDIGEVQSVATPRNYGYGFNLKDKTGRRWITLTYKTEAEAKAAREKIVAATAGVIDSAVSA